MRERCNPVKTVDSLTCTKYLLFKPNLGTNITHQSHVPRYKGSVIVTFFYSIKKDIKFFRGKNPTLTPVIMFLRCNGISAHHGHVCDK